MTDPISQHWHRDGPHTAEGATTAAQAVDDLTRYLNYATSSTAAGGAVQDPQVLAQVLGALREAMGHLPQLVNQLHARFADMASQPAAYIAPPATGVPDTDDLTIAVALGEMHAARAVGGANLTARALSDLQSLADRLVIDPDGQP